jgi:hypothetical protein
MSECHDKTKLPCIVFLIYLKYCINFTGYTAINQIQQDYSESKEMKQPWHVQRSLYPHVVLADHKKHVQDSWERVLAPKKTTCVEGKVTPM